MTEATTPAVVARPVRSRRSRWFVLAMLTLLAGGGYWGYKQLFAGDSTDGASRFFDCRS